MWVFLVFVLLVLLLCFFLGGFGSFLSASLLGWGFKDYVFGALVDEVSGVCITMLIFCGSVALFYCHHYFGGGVDGYLLFPLIVWFLSVMAILVFTSSLLFSLVLWEYLGLVSFFLILFYSNGYSLRAALITLFASRFGDVALFLLIMWVSSWYGSISFLTFVFLGSLVILTKSACYPFISWLLEAMRAPTPVSSLVHSSTLVAAGVWFLLRYCHILGDSLPSLLLYVSVVTILISGVCAACFCDLKKIVALSTCNNVSWCLLFFISGDLGLALLQLLTHGVCKCYLFMSVGDLMSLSGSSQSSVGVYLSRYSGGYGVVLQTLLILSLSGLPFLGVYFSKHCLFSTVLYSYGVGMGGLIVLGFLLTYVYSMRFVLLLVSAGGGLSLGYSSSFLIVSVICFFGGLVNYFGSYSFYDESFVASSSFSILLLLVQVLGCSLGAVLYFFNGLGYQGAWESAVWGGDCLVSALYGVYLFLSSLCVISFYRWELYFSGFVGGLRLGVSGVSSLFSLNFLVCSLVYIFFFLFFLLGVSY